MEIHRCRFVPYRPSAINALAFSHASIPNSRSKGPLNLRLAIGRANGNIEIWNPLRGSWFQESIIQGGKDRSVEGLVWTQDPEDVDNTGYKRPGDLRLFSIGYSSAVTEWDIPSGKPLRHSAGNYGEIWCMAAQPKGQPVNNTAILSQGAAIEDVESQIQNIAVGCADGSIVLLSTADGDLQFSRILARPSKKRSRVLSITFQSRYTIIAGHADSTIRIYDVRSKQQMRQMTLGAGPKGGPKEILVWSVKCLSDGTIVSGDSTGTLNIWDGKMYSLLQRIKGHEADILDIAVSANGQTVFSGGMDRRTCMYQRMESGQQGERHRWAKMTHRRYHKHDVKAMATFETKSLSIVASGGLDAAPIITPVQEFGQENHRTLSNLPHQPIIRSSARKRLITSWWDREISLWKISKPRAKDLEHEEPSKTDVKEGRKLVAKIVLQGEEAITFADLSSDGTMLAVLTSNSLKIFRLRSKGGSFKVQKLEAPLEITAAGGKSIHISPDQRWLAVVRLDNNVHLFRITKDENSKNSPKLLPKLIRLKRLARDSTKSNYQHGTLGKYTRSVVRLTFSSDSRILVVGDLSGFLDSWVLEGHEDLTQDFETANKSDSSSVTSDDTSSDEGSDEERHASVLFGQHWIRNPSASLLIKLPASPLVLSFRPSSTQSKAALTNGNPGVHPTRHTPHPHSHDLPDGEDRLVVVTAENQVYEFNVLSGKMSDWSRRNPTSSFPREFRDLRDRAMGVIWDVRGQNERIWLYGVAWLWMFDLSKDLPTLDKGHGETIMTNGEVDRKQLKRKRPFEGSDDDFTARSRHDTGAGSRRAKSSIDLGIGPDIRKVDGEDESTIHSRASPEQDSGSDQESDVASANEHDLALVSLRRNEKGERSWQQSDDKSEDDEDADGTALMKGQKTAPRPCHWHTFKYRPILGMVPLGGESGDEAAADGAEESGDESPPGLEVVLVERPQWEVELPPPFYGNQEWDS